jgi:hypothetical protein
MDLGTGSSTSEVWTRHAVDEEIIDFYATMSWGLFLDLQQLGAVSKCSFRCAQNVPSASHLKS